MLEPLMPTTINLIILRKYPVLIALTLSNLSYRPRNFRSLLSCLSSYIAKKLESPASPTVNEHANSVDNPLTVSHFYQLNVRSHRCNDPRAKCPDASCSIMIVLLMVNVQKTEPFLTTTNLLKNKKAIFGKEEEPNIMNELIASHS